MPISSIWLWNGKKGEAMQITIVIDSFEELKKLRSLLDEKADVNLNKPELNRNKTTGNSKKQH